MLKTTTLLNVSFLFIRSIFKTIINSIHVVAYIWRLFDLSFINASFFCKVQLCILYTDTLFQSKGGWTGGRGTGIKGAGWGRGAGVEGAEAGVK